MHVANSALSEREYLDQLLNEHDAARMLGFTIRALQNWRVRGGGPQFVKISKRSVRYRRRDLLAWVNKHIKVNTSQA